MLSACDQCLGVLKDLYAAPVAASLDGGANTLEVGVGQVQVLVAIAVTHVVAVGKGLHQPLDNFAKVRANGDPVAGAQVVSPYPIIFRPTPQTIAASDPTIDFRDDLAHNIQTGTAIYGVFTPDETQEMELNGKGVMQVERLLAHGRNIGRITTESEFITYKYGDYRLFFKHNARYIRNELSAAADSGHNSFQA